MSELKPCQMSQEQAAEKLQESFDYMSSVMPVERRRPATAELLNALSIAISVLRAQPANEPLTIDELREMDGEPVWLNIADGKWGLVNSDDDEIELSRCGFIKFEKVIGLAYRRPPERSENDG